MEDGVSRRNHCVVSFDGSLNSIQSRGTTGENTLGLAISKSPCGGGGVLIPNTNRIPNVLYVQVSRHLLRQTIYIVKGTPQPLSSFTHTILDSRHQHPLNITVKYIPWNHVICNPVQPQKKKHSISMAHIDHPILKTQCVTRKTSFAPQTYAPPLLTKKGIWVCQSIRAFKLQVITLLQQICCPFTIIGHFQTVYALHYH